MGTNVPSGDTMSKAPSIDELTSIRDLILLHMCLDVLEIRRSRAITEAENEHTDRILDAVTRDMTTISKELKERDIKILFESMEDKDAYLEYPYICRGYEDKFHALKDHFRAEIKLKLIEYKA